MIKLNNFGRMAAVALCALALAACSKTPKDDGAAAILEYVPADTPYVLAALEPAPKELADKLEPQLEMMVDAYGTVIDEAISKKAAELPEDSADRAEMEAVAAVATELLSFLTPEGMRNAGIDRESRMALYGNGLLPVLRIALADESKFDAAVAQLEESAGHTMTLAELDGTSYRYVDADKVKIVLATIDGYAVATLLPASFDDEQLGQLLGLTKPAKSMASTGELAEIAKEHGYTNHMIALFDTERLVSTFLDEQSGVNADLLALAEYDSTDLSDVCRQEIRDLAAIAPRMVAGYTQLTVKQLDSNMVIEIREDLAAGLATLPAAVPGLGKDQGGLFSFGMGFNLKAVRDFYSARLDALEADPFECERFADIQGGVAKGRAALQQPVPPIVYDIRGFNAVITDITGLDLASKQPPEDVEASFVLAVENAPALVQLGMMFSPEIAALDLQPDGKPVKFTPQQLQGQIDNMYLALAEDAVAFSIGDSADSGVASALEAATANPPPFMSMAMDADRYYELVGDAMMLDDGNGDDELSPEAREALRELMNSVGEIYERVNVQVMFTERGIEMGSVLVLGD